MTATEELCNKAAAYFHEGYNCTQAVLMALCEQMCGMSLFQKSQQASAAA